MRSVSICVGIGWGRPVSSFITFVVGARHATSGGEVDGSRRLSALRHATNCVRHGSCTISDRLVVWSWKSLLMASPKVSPFAGARMRKLRAFYGAL